MTTDNTKQNPTDEIAPVNEAELSEEMLGELNGGAIGPFSDLINRPQPPVVPEEPKDGGATGSW